MQAIEFDSFVFVRHRSRTSRRLTNQTPRRRRPAPRTQNPPTDSPPLASLRAPCATPLDRWPLAGVRVWQAQHHGQRDAAPSGIHAGGAPRAVLRPSKAHNPVPPTHNATPPAGRCLGWALFFGPPRVVLLAPACARDRCSHHPAPRPSRSSGVSTPRSCATSQAAGRHGQPRACRLLPAAERRRARAGASEWARRPPRCVRGAGGAPSAPRAAAARRLPEGCGVAAARRRASPAHLFHCDCAGGTAPQAHGDATYRYMQHFRLRGPGVPAGS